MSGWTDERSAAGKHNPWLIVAVISMATFMEVLDVSVANVSLDHIAGGLAASRDQAAWILTSYLVSNAIVIPISGWLSDAIGRKRYYMLSVAIFTAASLACGMAPSLGFLVFARIVQGVGGGGLAPSEQSFLADTFPPEKRGQAFAAYGIVVVCGPVLGPTLGGYITEHSSWHWVFLINVPIGILSLFLVRALVAEPEILEKERRERLRGGLKVDYVGFALVVLGLGSLELLLERGPRDAWFESQFMIALAVTMVVSLAFLVWWELEHRNPIVNLKIAKDRNFAITLMFMTATGAVLFGTTTLIPQMLQEVLGYNAEDAGLALTTGGVATLVAMPIVGMVAGKVDTRVLLIPALLTQAGALWYMTGWNTDISFHDASMGRLISAIGLPFLFIPINSAAYVGLRPDQTNEASALLNVARNIGGSLGIGLAQAILLSRDQFHQARIVENLDPMNPAYVEGINRLNQSLDNGGAIASLSALYQQVGQQARMMSYIDVFHVMMIVVLVIAPLGLLLRQGKARGAHG